MRCQGCEHERPKPQTAKVALPRTSQFNESVGIDIFEVKDKAGIRYSILSFVRLGTTYHQAAIIQEGATGQPSSRKFPGDIDMDPDIWYTSRSSLRQRSTQQR